MEKSTPEASLTFDPETFWDSPNAISSLGSEDGHLPCNSLAGQQTDLSGQEAAPASLSVPQVKDLGLLTSDTCGLCSPNSSEPASLQQLLANRLQARLGVNGSPEYSLTWKEWAINGQEPICALRASARRTSDSDFTGWPTAAARDWKNGKSNLHGKNSRPLNEVVLLTGWATPMAATNNPQAHGSSNTDFQREVEVAFGLRDSKNSPKAGLDLSSSPAKMVKLGAYQLNPNFSLWLMGYPIEWGSCGATAMQSCRKSRRSSSPPTLKPEIIWD